MIIIANTLISLAQLITLINFVVEHLYFRNDKIGLNTDPCGTCAKRFNRNEGINLS